MKFLFFPCKVTHESLEPDHDFERSHFSETSDEDMDTVDVTATEKEKYSLSRQSTTTAGAKPRKVSPVTLVNTEKRVTIQNCERR